MSANRRSRPAVPGAHPRPPRAGSRPASAAVLSQHRLRDSAVAARIINHTGLAPPQLVYEAGAGAGTLTEAIAARAGQVIAIERDRALWCELRARFATDPRVRPVLGDFLEERLPRSGAYSVVSNVPFAITARLMRKLLTEPNPPASAYLVLQSDAALKWAGLERETVASVVSKVRFTFTIPLALRRGDFVPRPRVDSVLLAMHRRPAPLLSPSEQPRFEAFVAQGFGAGKATLRRNLEGRMGYRAFQRASHALAIDRDTTPGEVSFEQWLALFRAAGK
jgi:23S rRNA (adenine-N6)-dimethyltransferase